MPDLSGHREMRRQPKVVVRGSWLVARGSCQPADVTGCLFPVRATRTLHRGRVPRVCHHALVRHRGSRQRVQIEGHDNAGTSRRRRCCHCRSSLSRCDCNSSRWRACTNTVHRTQPDGAGHIVGQPSDCHRRGGTHRISPWTFRDLVLVLRDRRTAITTRRERDRRRAITRRGRRTRAVRGAARR